MLRQQGLLLRNVETGGGANRDPLLVDAENAGRGADVVVGDAQPILRGKDLEIRVDDGRDRREDDHLAVEAARDRAEFGGAQQRAILSPEIKLVASIEHGAVGRAAAVRAA